MTENFCLGVGGEGKGGENEGRGKEREGESKDPPLLLDNSNPGLRPIAFRHAARR